MKKLVSLFLVAMLCLAMVPMHAFATESGAHVDHAKGCSHSGGTHPGVIVERKYDGPEKHKVNLVPAVFCSTCNAVLNRGEPVTIAREDHSFGSDHYISSYHFGNYLNHYYVYGRTCSICRGTYSWHVPSACTLHSCIDPQ